MLFFHNILSTDIYPAQRQGVGTTCFLLESVNGRRIGVKLIDLFRAPLFSVMVIVAGLRHGLFPGNTCTSSSVFRSAHRSGKTERMTESTVHTEYIPSSRCTEYVPYAHGCIYTPFIPSILFSTSTMFHRRKNRQSHPIFFSHSIHQCVSSIGSPHASTASR